MKIDFSPRFTKAYQKQIKKHPELITLFEKRLQTFIRNPFDGSLKTHKLSGNLKNFWSFRLTYSIRIIFEFITDDHVTLLIIGDHDDVY